MPDPTADPVAPSPNATGLASLLDTLARFQSAALLYPPTHRRIAESTGALVEALRRAADLRGEVRLAVADGRLLRDGALVPDLAGPARRLVADWDALGVARITFLPRLVPDDLVAFARFLKEAETQRSGGHRPTLASFELVPKSIDIESRDYGRPHRADESGTGDAGVGGGGGEGTGGGTGDEVGPGLQRLPRRPVDDEEFAARESTGPRDAAVPVVAPEELARQLRVAEEPPPERELLAGDDRVATLARILHLLGRATPPSSGRASLEARLADLVRQKCGDPEQAVVESGLAAMVHGARARELGSALDALAPALRHHAAERTAALLLELLDAQAKERRDPDAPPRPPQEVAATRRVLWVRLAQELLLTVGVRGDAIERRAGRLLAELDPEEFDAAVPELAALPAIRLRRTVKAALAPARTELYGLYRALLRVGGPIADDLAQNFALRPPATSAAGAFFALRDDVNAARAWLERFLAAARAGKEDSELLSSAGNILRTYLETLDPKRRGEPWVVSAVAALKRLSSHETDATLARIRGEKRMLLSSWPKACRDAAAGAVLR